MSEQPTTPFSDKCAILSDLWMFNRDDEEFQDFIEFNDLGLPIAYILDNGMVEANDKLSGFVDEAWNLLLAGLAVEDIGFQSLSDLLEYAEQEQMRNESE